MGVFGTFGKKWYIEMGCEWDSFIAKLCVYFESYWLGIAHIKVFSSSRISYQIWFFLFVYMVGNLMKTIYPKKLMLNK
jgi:hypothetical protein